jgi:hypothetical protein
MWDSMHCAYVMKWGSTSNTLSSQLARRGGVDGVNKMNGVGSVSRTQQEEDAANVEPLLLRKKKTKQV